MSTESEISLNKGFCAIVGVPCLFHVLYEWFPVSYYQAGIFNQNNSNSSNNNNNKKMLTLLFQVFVSSKTITQPL